MLITMQISIDETKYKELLEKCDHMTAGNVDIGELLEITIETALLEQFGVVCPVHCKSIKPETRLIRSE